MVIEKEEQDRALMLWKSQNLNKKFFKVAPPVLRETAPIPPAPLTHPLRDQTPKARKPHTLRAFSLLLFHLALDCGVIGLQNRFGAA